MEWSVTVVYYYVYFTNIQVVIYWNFFFTVMGDFETSNQKNSKETLRQQ